MGMNCAVLIIIPLPAASERMRMSGNLTAVKILPIYRRSESAKKKGIIPGKRWRKRRALPRLSHKCIHPIMKAMRLGTVGRMNPGKRTGIGCFRQ